MSKTLDKINNYLVKFLYATEDLDLLDIGTRDRLVEARNVGGKEYDDFFKGMLKKWKIKSYKDLPKEKQTKFFDEVDKEWEAKKETD